MHIFCPKNVHPLKTRCFMPFSSNFSGKYPCCHADIWSKLRQFCQFSTILWSKKVNRTPFLPIFHENPCSHDRILEKKRPISKKHTALMPKFSRKTLTFSKTLCSQGIFFKFTMKKPLLPCPYFVQKNVNVVKTTDYGPKK